MTVQRQAIGPSPTGRQADRYILTAGNCRAEVITYGAALVRLEAPDRAGEPGDVTVGPETATADGMATMAQTYFGVTVGRVANRIANATLDLDGRTVQLAANDGPHHLHGGVRGFSAVDWRAEPTDDGVKLAYTSLDGEEHYPGELHVEVVYRLSDAGELTIDYRATTSAKTLCNLTNHAYWNLTTRGGRDILGHELQLHACRYTPVDQTLAPSGELADVDGTPMDFRSRQPVGQEIDRTAGGYDHNFVVDGEAGQLRPAARLVEPESGRVMEVRTTEPGIQFYTGNFLDGSVTGKTGEPIGKHHALCLETQHFPDAPHHANFPSIVLEPGQEYRHTTVHRFSTD